MCKLVVVPVSVDTIERIEMITKLETSCCACQYNTNTLDAKYSTNIIRTPLYCGNQWSVHWLVNVIALQLVLQHLLQKLRSGGKNKRLLIVAKDRNWTDCRWLLSQSCDNSEENMYQKESCCPCGLAVATTNKRFMIVF